jgi:hypothetical protein
MIKPDEIRRVIGISIRLHIEFAIVRVQHKPVQCGKNRDTDLLLREAAKSTDAEVSRRASICLETLNKPDLAGAARAARCRTA